MQIPFENAVQGTFSLALELQIVDQTSLGLVARGAEIVADLDSTQHASRHVRSGVRQDFLELISGEHEHPVGLLAQMREITAVALAAAHTNHAYLLGGASHPWSVNTTGSAETADDSMEKASFCGARVQVYVKGADQAVRLAQGLSMYVPHMIALSASSPFLGGEDMGVASMRLQTAVPRLASWPRSIQRWEDFELYMTRRQPLSPDALPWEIVLRPELGAVEVRVMDAPLTVERAIGLAGWIQVLSEWLLRQDHLVRSSPVDHAVNRYQATLFGMQATYLGADGRRMFLQHALLSLMDELAPVADEIGCLEQIDVLVQQIQQSSTDEQWLRRQCAKTGIDGLVAAMANRFDAGQMPQHQWQQRLAETRV